MSLKKKNGIRMNNRYFSMLLLLNYYNTNYYYVYLLISFRNKNYQFD